MRTSHTLSVKKRTAKESSGVVLPSTDKALGSVPSTYRHNVWIIWKVTRVSRPMQPALASARGQDSLRGIPEQMGLCLGVHDSDKHGVQGGGRSLFGQTFPLFVC